MPLTRWDPFDDLGRIQERMNRMFEDSMTRSPSGEEADGRWLPAVDIYETADRVVLLADLPGVDQDDIELRVENDALILQGERRALKGVNPESLHRAERGTGRFQRTFTLPGGIDQDRFRAEHRNGVLEIYLPKSEGVRPKRIHVEVQS